MWWTDPNLPPKGLLTTGLTVKCLTKHNPAPFTRSTTDECFSAWVLQWTFQRPQSTCILFIGTSCHTLVLNKLGLKGDGEQRGDNSIIPPLFYLKNLKVGFQKERITTGTGPVWGFHKLKTAGLFHTTNVAEVKKMRR